MNEIQAQSRLFSISRNTGLSMICLVRILLWSRLSNIVLPCERLCDSHLLRYNVSCSLQISSGENAIMLNAYYMANTTLFNPQKYSRW